MLLDHLGNIFMTFQLPQKSDKLCIALKFVKRVACSSAKSALTLSSLKPVLFSRYGRKQKALVIHVNDFRFLHSLTASAN